MGAALGLRHRVDLVEDDPLRAGEEAPCLRGEHEVQRLGRGDEDVGSLAEHGRPLLLRRVAGAHRDVDVGADTAQRRPQVALHVVAERLERRDVDQPERPLLGVRRRRVRHEAVERPQEGGKGLAGAGGRRDERVCAGGDGRPGLHLRRRGLGERPREPLTHARRERCERGMFVWCAHVLCGCPRASLASHSRGTDGRRRSAATSGPGFAPPPPRPALPASRCRTTSRATSRIGTIRSGQHGAGVQRPVVR